MAVPSDLNGSLPSAAAATNGQTSESRFHDDGNPDRDDLYHDTPENSRPPSAPGNKDAVSAVKAKDDFEHGRAKRPPLLKQELHRSKSDYAPRLIENPETEEEIREWGARHGFEDHYQSDHIITQLASVCQTPLPPLLTCLGRLGLCAILELRK